jgi:acyl carrier protein
MTLDSIKLDLQPIFATVFSNPNITITENMNAENVDKWDSVTHLTMILEVESFYTIKFKLKELTSMKNVGDMIQIISDRNLGA